LKKDKVWNNGEEISSDCYYKDVLKIGKRNRRKSKREEEGEERFDCLNKV
jgi:hypothetical protein